MTNQIAMNRKVRDWINTFPGTVISDGQDAVIWRVLARFDLGKSDFEAFKNALIFNGLVPEKVGPRWILRLPEQSTYRGETRRRALLHVVKG